jgi:hypothetical protein
MASYDVTLMVPMTVRVTDAQTHDAAVKHATNEVRAWLDKQGAGIGGYQIKPLDSAPTSLWEKP